MFRVVLCSVTPLSGGCCPWNTRCTWRIGNIARAFWLVHELIGLSNACSVDVRDADCTRRSPKSRRLWVHEDYAVIACEVGLSSSKAILT